MPGGASSSGGRTSVREQATGIPLLWDCDLVTEDETMAGARRHDQGLISEQLNCSQDDMHSADEEADGVETPRGPKQTAADPAIRKAEARISNAYGNEKGLAMTYITSKEHQICRYHNLAVLIQSKHLLHLLFCEPNSIRLERVILRGR